MTSGEVRRDEVEMEIKSSCFRFFFFSSLHSSYFVRGERPHEKDFTICPHKNVSTAGTLPASSNEAAKSKASLEPHPNLLYFEDISKTASVTITFRC